MINSLKLGSSDYPIAFVDDGLLIAHHQQTAIEPVARAALHEAVDTRDRWILCDRHVDRGWCGRCTRKKEAGGERKEYGAMIHRQVTLCRKQWMSGTCDR
jgi:hypothetical protein